ncbi:MAG: hypothetical protein RQ862_04760 [Candidatus Caldarchaeales archaeon]|nr:hypothetical protein [Candidatus Caldarchaeales archaeon]
MQGAGAAILNTWQGRAAVGALAIMLGLSVYVVLVFPCLRSTTPGCWATQACPR